MHASTDRDHQGQPASILESARHQLTSETLRGLGGLGAVERYAARVDGLLRHLFDNAPRPSRPVVVAALGGYGRRHLCLHSDIDILIAFEGPIGPEEERFLRTFLHPLWDLGLGVGHQVRELADFEHVDRDNPEFLLALTEARPLAGDRALFERLETVVWTWETKAYLVTALDRLIAARHAACDDTFYQLEPDVKDAPGGLRDVTALRTIARLTNPALAGSGPADRARLDEAEDFLLRVRSILHLDGRRNHNVLSHEMQERAAHTLGYPGTEPRQQVERLMGDYFRHARAVSAALAWVRKAAPEPVGTNLVRTRDGIAIVDAGFAVAHPGRWLDLFRAAIDLDTPVDDSALALVAQHVGRVAPEDFFPTPAERDTLLAFLRPRAGLYARLSEMHDCGLLGRMFPEFQTISGRVVRDFYHKYTVDEHTLLTIRTLERLVSAAAPGRARYASLMADLQAPELLVLALLFHDVGKWRDEDHHLESTRMALGALERMAVPADAKETVEFLIREHLRMSLAAFRRDTEDPEVVRQLAHVVGTEERLKMLCLLTLADVSAVSPETMTPWREELLWQLYVDTYNHLTLGYADELIDRSQSGLGALLAARPADLAEDAITRFVEGLPRRYLQLFSGDAIYRHVRLSDDIHPDEVHVSLEQKGSAWELTVVTLDKPYLFSNICGVLSSFGMDILRGHAMTNPNGLVLDVFQFADAEQFLSLNPDAIHEFVHDLEEVVSGKKDIAARLRSRERSVLQRRGVPRFAPTVHADNQSSRRYTILDIVANNTVGLLHRISRVISRHACDVDLVLIATEGEKAIDVFHIMSGGAKLSGEAQAALAADLTRLLEGTDEAD